jgi:predicted transposase YdaD
VRAVYLNRFLGDWLEREPENPYIAALAPLAIDEDTALKAQAAGLWQRVQTAPLAPAERGTLSQILLSWFLERFRNLTAREVCTMLNLLIPLEETRGYQSIKAEGLAEGRAEGQTVAKAETLTRLLTRRFGPLPDWAAIRIGKADTPQLDAWLDGIFDAQSPAHLLGPKREAPAH